MIAQTWPSTLRQTQCRPEQNRGTTGSGHPELVQGCDPALTALFTPAHPRVGRYEVCTTSDAIETVAEREWTIEALEPLEAFGNAGTYDRFAISRLYGGRRVQVAHGWRQRDGEFESITLLSPYPDASLTTLMPGTMAVRWKCSMQNAKCKMQNAEYKNAKWPLTEQHAKC